MANSRGGIPSTRRTREHVIADLSMNFVERIVLEEGHVVGREYEDYGYDLVIRTVDENGYIEPDLIFLQLKATDSIARYEQPAHGRLAYPVEWRHARLWWRERMPVFLVLYDAQARKAYWLDVQIFLEGRRAGRADAKWVTFHIPTTNALRRGTIRRMRRRRIERLSH